MNERHRRFLLVAACLAAALLPAWRTASFYRSADAMKPIVIDVQRAYDRAFVSDFHDLEGGVQDRFRWTKEGSAIVLDHLPSGRLGVAAQIRVRRPPGEPLPRVELVANGVTVHRAEPPGGASELEFSFPFPGGPLRLGIESDRFLAGERELGIQVLRLDVRLPDGRRPSLRPAIQIGVAALLLVLALWVSGLSPYWSALIGGTFGLLASELVGIRGLAFSSYPRSVLILGIAGAALAIVTGIWARRRPWLTRGQRGVFVAAATASFVGKLGLVSYPHFVSSDGLFHAYRLIRFMEGEFWLTSVTQHQPPFDIPYPFALFALGTPFGLLGLDPLLVVKALTVTADTLAVMGVMYIGFRFLNDGAAAVLAAAVYHCTPISVLALSAGNLSNLFATSMTTLAFAALLQSERDGGSKAVLGMVAASLLALTGHFGLLIEGVVLWPAWAAALWLIVPPPVDPVRRRNLRRGLVAVTVATLVYYSGYAPLVASQWERALSPDYATGAVETVGALDKLRYNGAVFLATMGVAVPAVALLGGIGLLSRGNDALRALSAAWLATTGLFFVVDLFTAVEIRYWLQVYPLLALFAGSYLAAAFRRRGLGRFAAIAAGLYILYAAQSLYLEALLVRYH